MSYHLSRKEFWQMDIIKIILIAVGLVALLLIGYWLIGIVYGLFWLLIYAGIIGVIGYGGYKLFFEKEKAKPELEDKTPIGIAEMQNTDRALEEYKRKYLPK
jgi:membrane protein required for beta-lactamase induction